MYYLRSVVVHLRRWKEGVVSFYRCRGDSFLYYTPLHVSVVPLLTHTSNMYITEENGFILVDKLGEVLDELDLKTNIMKVAQSHPHQPAKP